MRKRLTKINQQEESVENPAGTDLSGYPLYPFDEDISRLKATNELDGTEKEKDFSEAPTSYDFNERNKE